MVNLRRPKSNSDLTNPLATSQTCKTPAVVWVDVATAVTPVAVPRARARFIVVSFAAGTLAVIATAPATLLAIKNAPTSASAFRAVTTLPACTVGVSPDVTLTDTAFGLLPSPTAVTVQINVPVPVALPTIVVVSTCLTRSEERRVGKRPSARRSPGQR